ncbi:DHA2 family efflux MFS transporter permease subunit [Embleya sp. NPDC050154]|uniref:DHA2 family efflux MFS transporter permease subunit n=1 Tax=unclassified Embleya TaxID=2699296 RepID=UPI00378CC904
MTTSAAKPAAPPAERSKALILVVIGLAQLMVALDTSLVNLILPWAQRDLGMSDSSRHLLAAAYMVAYGSLLPLGGRIADRVGYRRTLLVGLVGFAASSLVAGLAQNTEFLVTARTVQGVFGAILAPSTLAILTTTFTEPKERGRAFGLYTAIVAAGSGLGMVAGGGLTEYLSWRWCLYLNVPIAVIAVVGALIVLPDTRGHRETALDLPGAVLGGGGMVALMYGISTAGANGWGSTEAVTLLVGSVVLLAGFAIRQSKATQPLLPLRLLADRSRAGALIVIALGALGPFGLYLFLTYQLQVIMDYSPVEAGLACVPLTVATVISAGVISKLQPVVAPRTMIVPGLIAGAVAMVMFAQMDENSSYPLLILPALVLLGFTLGIVHIPATNAALSGLHPRDAGSVSAFTFAAQQLGGAMGTALFNTIATTATASYVLQHHDQATVLADGHGFRVATMWSAGLMVFAAVVAAVLINAKATRQTLDDPPPAEDLPDVAAATPATRS